jgi:hypothetical protein
MTGEMKRKFKRNIVTISGRIHNSGRIFGVLPGMASRCCAHASSRAAGRGVHGEEGEGGGSQE